MDTEDVVIRNMASSMMNKFDKYWEVIHDVMSVAIVLDPRYKLKLINYFFPKIYGVDAKDEVMKIRNLCNELFEEYKRKHDHNKGKGKLGTTNSDGGTSSLNKASWELDFENMITEDDMFERTELDDYLTEKLLPNEEGFDILMWWKCNGAKFPILQKIARDVLAIPISSVASESAFSMCANKITKQRSRLKPQTVAALMCTQSWLRKELKGNNYVNCCMIHVYIVFLTCILFLFHIKKMENRKDLMRRLHMMKMWI
jgi:hypothetical protein